MAVEDFVSGQFGLRDKVEVLLTPHRIEQIMTHTPMRRFGESDELVDAWCCSPPPAA